MSKTINFAPKMKETIAKTVLANSSHDYSQDGRNMSKRKAKLGKYILLSILC